MQGSNVENYWRSSKACQKVKIHEDESIICMYRSAQHAIFIS